MSRRALKADHPTGGTESITAGTWLAKPKRRTVARVASDAMTSCRARRMSERHLESEDIDSPLYRVRCMAVPQLVWVDGDGPGGSSPSGKPLQLLGV